MASRGTVDVDEISNAYAFDGPAIELGALVVDGKTHPQARVRLPLSMMNRHGLVAGATGTGKTKTLQLIAEQLSTAGVPVFLADIKGDLSGMAAAGKPDDNIGRRASDIGYEWTPMSSPAEFFSLGGVGKGVPIRSTMTAFGPTLLAKVLGLNDVQESSLGLIFHYADKAGLPLLDLKDLRAVVHYLTSDEGLQELKDLGGLSRATAGVILRQLVAFETKEAERFFGEPEFDTADLLRTAPDGRGVVSILELPSLQDRPALSSTPVAWTLLRAPQTLMAPCEEAVLDGIVAGSPLTAEYGQSIDRDSAYERLNAKLAGGAAAADAGVKADSEPAEAPRPHGRSTRSPTPAESPLEKALETFAKSAATTLGREIMRGVFGTARRRRR